MQKEILKITIPKLGKEVIEVRGNDLNSSYLDKLLCRAEQAGPINGVLMMLSGKSNWMLCLDSNLEVKMIDSSFFFTDPFEKPNSKNYFKSLRPLQKNELVHLFIDFANDIEKTIKKYE